MYQVAFILDRHGNLIGAYEGDSVAYAESRVKTHNELFPLDPWVIELE